MSTSPDVVLDEMILADPGGLGHPLALVAVDVDRTVDTVEQCGDALDGVPHHRATDVVRVIVGREHAGHGHVVGLDRVDDVADRVGRVDEHALAGRAVADRVDEVDHLLGEHVAHCEIPAGQQLTEVQAIVAHPLQCGKRPYASSHG